MKLFMRLILLCALVGTAFFFYQRSKQQNTSPLGKTVRLGISADNPPFTFVKEGKFVGFELDLARAIAAETAYNLEIMDLDFSGLIAAVKNDVIDVSISGFNITEERKKNVAFSHPYYHSKLAVIGHKKYTSAAEFSNARIGVQHGSLFETAAKKLQEKFPQLSIVGFHRINQAVQELEQKGIDIILIDTAVADQIVMSHPLLQCSLIEEQDEESGLGVVFKKDSPLIKEFNAAIEKLKANGTLEALSNKWLVSTKQSPTPAKE